MHILAVEHELHVRPTRATQSRLREEAARVWELMQRGIVRQIWFTTPDHRAVLMMECGSGSEAREHLATLPLVQDGHIEFLLLELRNYDGFERLFAAGVRKPSHPPPAEHPASPMAAGDVHQPVKSPVRRNGAICPREVSTGKNT